MPNLKQKGEDNSTNARRGREVPQVEGGERAGDVTTQDWGQETGHCHGQDVVVTCETAECVETENGRGCSSQQETKGMLFGAFFKNLA